MLSREGSNHSFGSTSGMLPARVTVSQPITLTCTHFTLIPGQTNFLQMRLALLSPQVMGYTISASKVSSSSAIFTSHREQRKGQIKKKREPQPPAGSTRSAKAQHQKTLIMHMGRGGNGILWPRLTCKFLLKHPATLGISAEKLTAIQPQLNAQKSVARAENPVLGNNERNGVGRAITHSPVFSECS